MRPALILDAAAYHTLQDTGQGNRYRYGGCIDFGCGGGMASEDYGSNGVGIGAACGREAVWGFGEGIGTGVLCEPYDLEPPSFGGGSGCGSVSKEEEDSDV